MTEANTVETNTAPAPESTPAPAAVETAATPAPQATPQGAASVVPEVQPWTPDFKFKVKEQEHEVDEFLRAAIKDEESLKKVKRLYEQAYGLPEVSKARDEWKTKYESVQPTISEYQTVQSQLNRLSHFVQNKDYGTFFESLKIPKNEVFAWVKSELDKEALPTQVREQLERARQAEAKAYDYEQQMSMFEQQRMAQEREQQFSQLDQFIASTAKDIATQFNERIGDAQAFRNAVINRGISIQETTGQKLPADQVIQLVAQDLKRVMGIEAANAAAQAAAPAPGSLPGAPTQKPVIPAVRAGGQSPVQKSPRSIADIKELANRM